MPGSRPQCAGSPIAPCEIPPSAHDEPDEVAHECSGSAPRRRSAAMTALALRPAFAANGTARRCRTPLCGTPSSKEYKDSHCNHKWKVAVSLRCPISGFGSLVLRLLATPPRNTRPVFGTADGWSFLFCCFLFSQSATRDDRAETRMEGTGGCYARIDLASADGSPWQQHNHAAAQRAQRTAAVRADRKTTSSRDHSHCCSRLDHTRALVERWRMSITLAI